MKPVGGVLIAMLLAGGASAQVNGSFGSRSFGSVVFPGGTRATSPNISRNFGSVVFPGGSPTTPPVRGGASVVPPLAVNPVPPLLNGFTGNSFNRGGFNGGNSFNHGGGGPNRGDRGGDRGRRGNNNNNGTVILPYPIYVGGGYGYGGYGNGYYDPSVPPEGYVPPMQPSPEPSNVMVYPPQQDVRPIIIQMPPMGQMPPNGQYAQRPPSSGMQVYQGGEPVGPVPVDAAPVDPQDQPHFLIAFKDHSIYSSVAYWFDGDTLHYFTTGDKHNQAPVALLDRDLTQRLNRESGVDFRLPPAK